MKPVLMNMDSLPNICGYFTTGTELNGGYGCTHKSNEKDYPGCCYSFDCPLANVADLNDLKKHDKYLYEEYKDSADEDGSIESDWVVQYKKGKGE